MTLDDVVRYEIASSWWADRCSWPWLQHLAARWFMRKARRKYARYLAHLAYRANQARIVEGLRVLEQMEQCAQAARAAETAPTQDFVPLFSDIKFHPTGGFYFADRLHPHTRQPIDIVYLGLDIESAEKWYEANVPSAQRVTS